MTTVQQKTPIATIPKLKGCHHRELRCAMTSRFLDARRSQSTDDFVKELSQTTSMLCKLNALPDCTKSETDNEHINRFISNTGKLHPKRMEDLIDKLLPRWKKSMTGNEPPNLAIQNTESALPDE